MEINSSDRNMHPSIVNSPAQASGSQGAVRKVTNNPTSLPSDLGPAADEVALSDDVTPWTEQDHGKMSEYMFMPLPHESVSYYEKKVRDITSALRHCEDQLEVTRKEKQEIESDFNALRYENNDLRSKYTGACSSYTYISEELNRPSLKWRECRDLSLTMASGMNRVEPDPTMLEEIKKVEAGLKKESWDCLKEITNAPELSTSVLRFVLRTASGASSSGAV
ncbi:hypothetical protein Tco_1310743 [Tanacetum coccineum]